ncbi:hypothetical protein ACFTUC_16465 [Streptomyces sp. NPDC056944]|uniref:hypothetical protein n=1 Tax=Streptomyces sp. NPDC056944 TaxID=3345972 RepID=UPI0036305A65
MSANDATNPIAKPQDLHATGTGSEQIVTKDLHATSEPANAIADKILTREQAPVTTTDDLHATTEPAN